jgi:pro-sigmaK processing inhibitor BofA
MNYFGGASAIIFMCVVILCMISLRKKMEFLLNFMLRAVTGMIAVFLINEALAAQNVSVLVGINPWTALTSGILGIPGVALLYGIRLLNFL